MRAWQRGWHGIMEIKCVEAELEGEGVSFFGLLLPLVGWADPGGTAIPGQPVARTEQAPIP